LCNKKQSETQLFDSTGLFGYVLLTLAVTSISSFIFSSSKPATNIVAAGRAFPKYLLKTGQQGSKSDLFGKI
jgi:hypothetical protein